MYDQSFNYVTLSRMLRKNDFYVKKWLRTPALKEKELEYALDRVSSGFTSYSFLSTTVIRRKNVYRIAKFCDELILRKIDTNLKKAYPLPVFSRDSIIASLKSLISESIQYKIYRLDISSFYESFHTHKVLEKIDSIKSLSPITKRFLKEILEGFIDQGGKGLPRGLSISATLSEIMMDQLDKRVLQLPGVFYYRRYVDDIIIITSGEEGTKQFIKSIGKFLPDGLYLNKKKENFCSSPDPKPFKASAAIPLNPVLLNFEYLGYRFTVFEALASNNKKLRRQIYLDIAEAKTNKIKTRITRSLIDFCSNKDFSLLEMRIRFLTSNFSVLDVNKDSFRLAGIYHNYHRINFDESVALKELDEYLHKAVLSSHGKIFNNFYCNSTSSQRRRLLTFSFIRGFKERTYTYYSSKQFIKVQECWEYV
ncbi:MAG: antiviral reverse transcriptase Drt3a [Pseudomonas sp.]|nr:antiviral reverse transcriptase Drt3a [Pseudomonas sp.]